MSSVAEGKINPRIRYAKAELTRLATALELADPDRVELGMRTLELEDQLREAYELASRWRRSYEGMRDVLVAGSGPNPDTERLDELMRIWAVAS